LGESVDGRLRAGKELQSIVLATVLGRRLLGVYRWLAVRAASGTAAACSCDMLLGLRQAACSDTAAYSA